MDVPFQSTPSITQTTPAGHSIIYRLEHIETVLGETSTPLSTRIDSKSTVRISASPSCSSSLPVNNHNTQIVLSPLSSPCQLNENVPVANSPSIVVMLHQVEKKIDQQSKVKQLGSLEKAIGKNGEDIAQQALRIEKLELTFQQLSLDLKDSTDAEEVV